MPVRLVGETPTRATGTVALPNPTASSRLRRRRPRQVFSYDTAYYFGIYARQYIDKIYGMAYKLGYERTGAGPERDRQLNQGRKKAQGNEPKRVGFESRFAAGKHIRHRKWQSDYKTSDPLGGFVELRIGVSNILSLNRRLE
jgi:hypothetical protein